MTPQRMEKVRETQKKYCSQALMVAILTGFVFYLAGMTSVCKGLVLGTLFSILNFIILGETLPIKFGRLKGKPLLFSFGSMIFRYFILAVPLIIAIKLEQYNLIAVIIGIFFVQLLIIADHVLDFLLSARGSQV